MERETGIEPATNSLEGCDSTTELLPRKPAVSYQLSALSKTSAAKPLSFTTPNGTAKVVPFHKTFSPLQMTLKRTVSNVKPKPSQLRTRDSRLNGADDQD